MLTNRGSGFLDLHQQATEDCNFATQVDTRDDQCVSPVRTTRLDHWIDGRMVYIAKTREGGGCSLQSLQRFGRAKTCSDRIPVTQTQHRAEDCDCLADMVPTDTTLARVHHVRRGHGWTPMCIGQPSGDFK